MTTQFDPLTVIEFLKALRPGGPWALSVVYPFSETPRVGDDVGTRVGRVFDELDAAMAWVGHRTGKANVHYTANPLRWHEISWDRAPTGIELAAIEFLFADIDHWKIPGQTVEAVVNRLMGLPWPPTCIVSSGGGIQAIWRLEVPLTGETRDIIMRGRTVNQALLEVLGQHGIAGDTNVVNPVHLLRLPGTLNIPDARKQAAGRVAAMATLLVSQPDLAYPVEAFPEVPPARTASLAAGEGWRDIEIERVDEADVEALPPRLREIVMTGSIEGEKLPGDNSRSGWAFYAALHLVRLGWPPERIVGLMLDGPWGVEEKPDPEREAKRTAWRAMQMVSAWTEAERQRFDSVIDVAESDVEAILGDGPVVGQAELNDILGD